VNEARLLLDEICKNVEMFGTGSPGYIDETNKFTVIVTSAF